MLLDEIKVVTGERGRDYDHPLPNHLRISLAWSLQDAPFVHNPIDVALKMDLLKTMREIKTVKWDNYRDKMGYVNCVDMMCGLYCEIKYKTIILYEFRLQDDDIFLTEYKDMNDAQKAEIVKKLKNLAFFQQYDLLLNCMEYLGG